MRGNEYRKSTVEYHESSEAHFGLNHNLFNIICASLAIIGQVGENVELPIWIASAPNGQDFDSYFILLYTCVWFTFVFFLGACIQYKLGFFSYNDVKRYLSLHYLKQYILVGFFTSLNGLVLVFAAPPNRTPAFLQAALTNIMIPLVLIIRFIILKKRPNLIQFLCSIGVIIGLFLTSVPSIFDLDPTSSQESHANGVWVALWPIIFMLAFIPAALYTVLEEKYLQNPSNNNNDNKNIQFIPDDDSNYNNSNNNTNTNNNNNDAHDPNIPLCIFLTGVTFCQTLTFLFFFWYDLLPTIGFAKTFDDLINNFYNDLRYSFLLDGASTMACAGCFMFIGFYCLQVFGASLLLRYTEGASWAAMVQALVTPLGELFWVLFGSPDNFGWNPQWSSTSWYPLIGLFVMMPCVYIYNRYSEHPSPDNTNKNKKEKKHKNKVQELLIEDE